MFASRHRPAMAEEDESAYVPDWVPELSPGTRADVYPVEGRQSASSAELRLDRTAVTSGYAERRKAYEFHTCVTGVAEAPPRSNAVPLAVPAATLSDTTGDGLARMITKIRAGLSVLRRARPAKVQRVELGRPAAAAAATGDDEEKKRALFPYQKPSASSSLDDWFNKLSAGGAFSTSSLCAAVPLGPAIVRAAGRVLEMMASRDVPTQRAAWYIRIAVLNECVKQVRPDRPPPSPRVFWTKQLCSLLKTELDAIRARKSSSLGNMDRVAFWRYVLDLARWQADETLLDDKTWLNRIVVSLRAEAASAPTLHTAGAKIVVAAVQRFMPQLLSGRTLRAQMKEALMPVAAQALGAAQAGANRTTPPPKRGQSRAAQCTPITSTLSQVAFNEAVLRLANLLGSAGPTAAADRRLKEYPPESFTSEAVIDKAFELMSTAKDDGPKPKVDANVKSAAKEKKEKSTATDIKSPLHVTAALERFPITGNPVVLRRVMQSAFLKRGGDRAAIEHICKWAVAAKSLDITHVVSTAAAAIEILVTAASLEMKEPAVKAELELASSQARSSPQAPPPMFHREIWMFLKELGEEEDRETCESDERVVALVARCCRIGVFSLPIFVRDVARVACVSQGASLRLIRYVQMLPEPNESHAADARRVLLRRNQLLPAPEEQYQITAAIERAVTAIKAGEELKAIHEGAQLRRIGETRIQLAVVDGVVEEVTEAQDKALDRASVLFRATVSFLRAAGAAPRAVDFTMSRLGLLLAAQNSGARGIFAGIVVGVECLQHLSPLLAATNQLSAAIVMLGRVWNIAVGNAVQQRIRGNVERVALMIGKFFCSAAPEEHENWKHLVLSALPVANLATMKQLYCGLLAGVSLLFFEQNYTVTTPQMFLAYTTHCIRIGMKYQKWMASGVDMQSKHSTLRKALIETIEPSSIERFYKELMCISQVADGVIIPVLRVSNRLNTVKGSERDAYRKGVKNITSILCSTWMEALGCEMRLHSLVEIIALLLVGAHCQYRGAKNALLTVCSRPWVRRLVALYAGKGFYKHLCTVTREYTPNDYYNEGPIMRKISEIIAILCGKPREDDEAAIIGGIGVEPAGATQMQMCCALTSRRLGGTEHDFARHIAGVIQACISYGQTSVLSGMLLQCYDSDDHKAIAAGEIALSAADAMQQSLTFFTRGITAETRQNSFDNQQRASDWFRADEARRAILSVAAPHVRDAHAVKVASALVVQMDTMANELSAASAAKCVPGDGSPAGLRTSDAIESRAVSLLALERAVPDTSRAAARLLAASAFLLRASTADALIALIAARMNEKTRAEVRSAALPAAPWLEHAQKGALERALGDSAGAKSNALHKPVLARRANGKPIDTWYLLEGYGRGEDEDAAIPLAAFGRQKDVPTQSVRLKRTYATFSCLVR